MIIDIHQAMLKTYIISHHSQTIISVGSAMQGLRPILFHIILKQCYFTNTSHKSLRPILFHIILKHKRLYIVRCFCLRPILFHIILKPALGRFPTVNA